MSKLTKNAILTELYTSKVIDEIIHNITKGSYLKEDLKSELFLILAEMKEERIITAYKDKYIKFLCINIITKQFNSSKSPFHTKYRKNKVEDITDEDIADMDICNEESYEEEYDKEIELLALINKYLDTLTLIDKELFKLYYKMGDYDRWIGSKRDTKCTKNISSYRKIQNKLALIDKETGTKITIDHSTIANSIKKTTLGLKTYLAEEKYKNIIPNHKLLIE